MHASVRNRPPLEICVLHCGCERRLQVLEGGGRVALVDLQLPASCKPSSWHHHAVALPILCLLVDKRPHEVQGYGGAQAFSSSTRTCMQVGIKHGCRKDACTAITSLFSPSPSHYSKTICVSIGDANDVRLDLERPYPPDLDPPSLSPAVPRLCHHMGFAGASCRCYPAPNGSSWHTTRNAVKPNRNYT
ncbi:hypothetical protein LX32DRAFT_168415 [Colletotrichum zoysiae]|uniref:Uncharacterized protein n=1 Tax=Colletotrichum zoysiae TaxID=1216348 RepID=A0AAD9M4B7_9PEZI|nr:hypothetical protein LX32DRAFT_168415 [Colletotrichum zoysiae]